MVDHLRGRRLASFAKFLIWIAGIVFIASAAASAYVPLSVVDLVFRSIALPSSTTEQLSQLSEPVSLTVPATAEPLAAKYWKTNGTIGLWDGSNWGSSSVGPFNQGWTNGDDAHFTANSSITVVTTAIVGNLYVSNASTVTLSPNGTFSTGGNVSTFDVGAGSVLNFSTQNISTAVGTGIIKTGEGTFFSGPGNAGLSAGFTLNQGTMIVGGINAMGSGLLNSLTINGGTIAADTTRSLTGKYPAGITVGGNFQLGELPTVNPLAASGAALTFDNAVSFGSSTRTITIGGTTTYTFEGPISGDPGVGLIVDRTPGGNGILRLNGLNTYTGPTIIDGGKLRLGGTGSIALSPVIEIRDDGTFLPAALTVPLVLSSGQTLRGSGTDTTGFIEVNSTKSVTLAPDSPLEFTAFDGSTPPLTLQGTAGSLVLHSTNPVLVTVAGGTPLDGGTYKLISKGSGNASVVGLPTGVTVNGDGVCANCVAQLSLTGGELFLVVTEPPPAPVINIKGNGQDIVNGDSTPSLDDHTDFDNVGVAAGTRARTFTIENTGNADLTLSDVSVIDPNSEFSLTGPILAPTITPGNSASFEVTFNPSFLGERTATVSISSNDTDKSPYTFAIKGTGVTDPSEPAAFRQLSVGGSHSCAILLDGSVKCWGLNDRGQLGLGDTANRGDGAGEMGANLPAVDLGTGRTATAISAGTFHTCALLDDGTVKCWGDNQSGELGIGDNLRRGDGPGEMGDALPTVDLGTGRTATAVSASQNFTCALLDDGTVKCWGSNVQGKLGQGDTANRGDGPNEMGDNLPAVDLGTGRTAVSVVAGGYHACALLDNVSVKCWGSGSSGALGQESLATRGDQGGEMGDALPVTNLGTGRTATAITAGEDHTCAVLDDGSVKCWGQSNVGQIGLGTIAQRGSGAGSMGDNLPKVDLGTGRTAVAIRSKFDHTCAALDNGSLKCWGWNAGGQLGLANTADRGDGPGEMGDNLPAVDLGTGRTVASMATGGLHTCARLDDGAVKCWGFNDRGQLGLGDTVTRGDGPGEMGDDLPVTQLVTPVPTVTNITPTSGPTVGGNGVVITGTNFTGATAVTFGGTAATAFTVDSDTQITATAPAHAAGAVSVEVTTPVGTNAANLLYTYVASSPQLSINDVSQNEGDIGPTNFTFQVTLSDPAMAGGVTFNIATADGTATVADNDYEAKSLTGQTIPEGSSSYNFTVTVNGDVRVEGNETFFVNVANVTGATVADGQGQATLVQENTESDFSILFDLRDNHGFGTAFSWPTTTVPCPANDFNWPGVTCSDGRVAVISVGCVAPNFLTAPFPGTQIAGLTALISLDIRSCYLAPQAASNFAPLDTMTQLTELQLDENIGITGTIDDIFPQGLSPTRFPVLSLLDLNATSVGGQIPASVMDFGPSSTIALAHSAYSGTLPATGNPPLTTRLSGNALEGVLPDYIRNAVRTEGRIRVRYNKFDVVNTPPGNIDTIDPGWRDTQTVPPTNVQVTPNGAGSASLTWTPISYQAHGGYYEVLSATTPGGPYTTQGTTSSTGAKTAMGLTVSGLPAGTNYFVVRTFTPAHTGVYPGVNPFPNCGRESHYTCASENNPNDLTSVNSAEVSANIAAAVSELSINDVSQNEGNSGTTTFTFNVTLSDPAPSGGVTFDIATANGTATAGSDYVAKSLTGQVIPQGSSGPYEFAVTVNGDDGREDDETFFVNVTNVTGATVTDGQGLGTIINDDFSLREPDLTIMRSLRDTYGWGTVFSWPASDPCPNDTITWGGLGCENGRVISFNLGCASKFLDGPVPDIVWGLPNLQEVSIRGCRVTGVGPIPGGSVPLLRTIRLDVNRIDTPLDQIFPDGFPPGLELLNLGGNLFSGQIPVDYVNAAGQFQVVLADNRLSGPLPAVGPTAHHLMLNINGFEGVVPDYIVNGTGPVDLRYNKFDVVNTPAGPIDTRNPGWRDTQTVPPTNVQIQPNGPGSATLSWTPIGYSTGVGHYEVLSSLTPGGPYVSRGTTAATGAKTATGLIVSGLPAGTNYFVVRTYSEPPLGASGIQRALTSVNSAEVSAEIFAAGSTVNISGGNVTINENGAGSNDNITLSCVADPDSISIHDPNNPVTAGPGTTQSGPNTVLIALAQLTGSSTLTFNGSGGDDTLNVNLSGCDIIPGGGLFFNGGDPTTAPGDTLNIIGGNQGTVTYNYTNASDGSVVMSNFGTITYTGLEPISNTGTATDVIFNLPAAASNAVLEDDGTSGNGFSRLRSSNGTFETTDFVNPTGSVTINRGNAADTLTVTALPDFNAGLALGAAGSQLSTISFNGTVSLASGKSLSGFAAGAIGVAGSISTTGGGSISLTSGANLTVEAGIDGVRSTNGTVFLHAGQDLLLGTLSNFGDVRGNGLSLSAGRDIVVSATTFVQGDGLAGVGATAGRDITIQGNSVINANAGSAPVSLTTGVGGILTVNNPDGTSGSASNGGSITVTADDVVLTSGNIGTTGIVAVRPVTVGRAIDLGVNTAGTLGWTDAELDRVTAGTLNIGDADSGTITTSADITRPAATNMNLVTGGDVLISGGQINTGGGTLLLDPGNSPAAVKPTKASTDVTATTLSFGSDLAIVINGTAVDTQYTQLNVVGGIDLTGVSLVLSGSHTPAAGQQFVIVNNDGSDAITGIFTGLAEGATITNFLGASGVNATISYTGGTGNDAVITVDNVPPTVTSTTPVQGATGVDRNGDITLNFSETVNIAAGGITLNCGGVQAFSPTLPQNGVTTITIDPTATLPAGVLCTVTGVSAGVTDIPGNQLDGDNNGSAGPDFVLTFTTACTANPVVVNTNDSGAGSLRQAIADACPNSTITFNDGSAPGDNFHDAIPETTTLTSGELVINRNLIIEGPTAAELTVSGNLASRVFYVSPGNTVVLNRMTIANGSVAGGFPAGIGGGIYNDRSTLTLNNMIVRNNASEQGGGISTINGDLAVNFSTIRNNTSGSGGGISSRRVTGGSAVNLVTINNSTISGNTATGGGGGIRNDCAGLSSTANIINTTISGNTAASGGGIENFALNCPATLNLYNNTVAGNTGTVSAGGIRNHQQTGGTAVANLNSSIIGDNTSPQDPDISDTGTLGGSYNLVETTTGYTFGSGSNNIFDEDPMLAPLDDNGGPTQTHALLAGSPAINAGSDCVLTADGCGDGNPALTTDQRGSGFPRKIGASVDIGAFEVQDLTPPETQIDSAPSNPSNGSSPSFTFSGTDTGGSGVAYFECRLVPAAFAVCTSPQDYTGLADGSHTFEVRAVDAAGNTDQTPASHTWVIDTSPPAAPVVTTPANGSFTNDNTPTYSGMAEPNSTVSVIVDGSSIGTTPANGAGAWSLTQGTPLAEGSHTVRARAADAAGNISTDSNTNTFVVDTTPPDTTITGNPTNPSGSTSASFSFNGSDTGGSGVAGFECQMDGTGFAPCTSPANYTDLAPGTHTFEVRARDNAGNLDTTPASYTWVINTPPTITAVVGVARMEGSPGSNSTIANVTDIESGNGGVTVTVTSANPSNGVEISNIQNNGTGGITADVVAACDATNATFILTATDGGGMTATESLNITVNANTPPSVTYSDPAAIVYGQNTAVSPASAADNGSITGYEIFSQGTYTGGISIDTSTGEVTFTNAANAGTHTITVRSTDNCGDSANSSFQLTVTKADQTINVTQNAPASAVYNTTFDVAANASSGLPVTITASGACTGGDTDGTATITMTSGTGTCVVTYDQAGNGNFNAAQQITQTTQAEKADTVTVITNPPPSALTNRPDIPAVQKVREAARVTWSVTPSPVNPGSTAPTGTVTITDGTDSCTAAVTAGGCDYIPTSAGIKTLVAIYSGDDNYNGSQSDGVTHTVVAEIAGNVMQLDPPFAPTNLQGVLMTLAGTNAPAPVQTDANGNYSFIGVFTGDYTVTPTMAGKTFDPMSRTYTGLTTNITNANFTAYNAEGEGANPRNLRVENGYTVPGQTVSVPLVLTATGNEAKVKFRLTYDTSLLNTPNVTCGAASGAGCTITDNGSSAGTLDVTVDPVAVTYNAGQREVAVVTFNTTQTNQSQTPLMFTAAQGLTQDAQGDPLLTSYTNGFVVFEQGMECDLAGRFTGDGLFQADDGDVMRQLIAGAMVNRAYNEFQRADCAPFATKGDGVLDATDFQQSALTIAVLEPQQTAGGPFGPLPAPPPFAGADSETQREMRVVSTTAGAGDKVTVDIELNAQGDETAASFTLAFDPMKLRGPVIAGAPAGTRLTANTDQAADGRVMVLVDGSGLSAHGIRRMVSITFDVAAAAPTGDTLLYFTSDPTGSAVSDKNARPLATRFTSGTVTINGPNAEGVNVSGRVFTPEGAGLRNAQVVLTDENGATRTVFTSSLGYYTFEAIAPNRSYRIAVVSKRFRFESRTLSLANALTEIDFIAQE